jgi:hypothetical protein
MCSQRSAFFCKVERGTIYAVAKASLEPTRIITQRKQSGPRQGQQKERGHRKDTSAYTTSTEQNERHINRGARREFPIRSNIPVFEHVPQMRVAPATHHLRSTAVLIRLFTHRFGRDLLVERRPARAAIEFGGRAGAVRWDANANEVKVVSV